MTFSTRLAKLEHTQSLTANDRGGIERLRARLRARIDGLAERMRATTDLSVRTRPDSNPGDVFGVAETTTIDQVREIVFACLRRLGFNR